jgi:predicted membrane protein
MSLIGIPLILLAVLLVLFAISTHSLGMIVSAAILLLAIGISLSLVTATLHAIYTAALYRYATGSKEDSGVGQELLAGAFRQK